MQHPGDTDPAPDLCATLPRQKGCPALKAACVLFLVKKVSCCYLHAPAQPQGQNELLSRAVIKWDMLHLAGPAELGSHLADTKGQEARAARSANKKTERSTEY